jgi:hypothetical protein
MRCRKTRLRARFSLPSLIPFDRTRASAGVRKRRGRVIAQKASCRSGRRIASTSIPASSSSCTTMGGTSARPAPSRTRRRSIAMSSASAAIRGDRPSRAMSRSKSARSALPSAGRTSGCAATSSARPVDSASPRGMADEAHRLIVDPVLAPGRRGVVAGRRVGQHDIEPQRLQLPQKLPDGAGAQDHRHVGVLNQRTQEVQLEVARQRGQRADADHLRRARCARPAFPPVRRRPRRRGRRSRRRSGPPRSAPCSAPGVRTARDPAAPPAP